MNRITISLLLVFGAVVALYISILTEPDEINIIDDTADELIPNYEATNLKTKLFDETGRLNHEVKASKMAHYEQLGFVTFDDPEYIIYLTDNKQPWRLTAKEGTLFNDDRIQLEQNVIITSLGSADFVNEIKTHFIEIDLSNKVLTSDQDVIIKGNDYVVNSIGFYANLETKQYELSKHVQTLYAPKN